MHIFFKISHSHYAFHAESPAAHKAHLAIEKWLPHHKHLDIREDALPVHSKYIRTDRLDSSNERRPPSVTVVAIHSIDKH